MEPRIQGVFTPSVVLLDANGAINEPELRRYVDWLIEKGVHGLYPNGSTGEFTRFTADERRQIVKIVCDQAAGRVPVLAGAAEADVRQTLLACETYAGYGARALECFQIDWPRGPPPGENPARVFWMLQGVRMLTTRSRLATIVFVVSWFSVKWNSWRSC